MTLRLSLSIAILGSLFSSVSIAQTTSTWTGNAPPLPGGGADLSWHSPGNWDNGIVPNGPGATAIVPNNFSVEITGQIAIDNFVLGQNSVLFNRDLVPGTQLDVTSSATVEGLFSFHGFGGGGFTLPLATVLGDFATFAVREGAVGDVGDVDYRVLTSTGSSTVLQATDVGSILDLSSIETIEGISGPGAPTYTIAATNGGLVDLSGLRQINHNIGNGETLRFTKTSGGEVDLSSLEVIAPTDPNLVRFDVGNQTWNLPALIQADRTVFDFDANGVVNAPNLNRIRYTSVQLEAGATFNTGALSSIDHTTFAVVGGAQFGASVVDANYSYSVQTGSAAIFSATDAGSILDLSSIETIEGISGPGAPTYTIAATNGGLVDLSGLRQINHNIGNGETLRFTKTSGGEVDLSSLEVIAPTSPNHVRFDSIADWILPSLSVAHRTTFDIGSGRTLSLPALDRLVNSTVTVGNGGSVHLSGIMDTGTAVNLADISSAVSFGNVMFNPGSVLNVPTASTVIVLGDFLNNMTVETSLGIDDAIAWANGGDVQLLEVGGQDLGIGGATSGNFGVGQLLIGDAAGPVTTVELAEVFDNGNRGLTGLNGEEALYLFGLGGPDGLRIEGGSVLALNSINVYAWDGAIGQQIHLNSLFGPGAFRIPFDNGFLQLGLGGDFNGDSVYDCADIDELVARIAAGSNEAPFDLTGDGQVTLADRDQWLAEAGAANLASGNSYLLGDANLDGVVDGADFVIWNAHKFQSASMWCAGDFNADGNVDGQDFLIWNSNKFTSAATATVPEPSSLVFLLSLIGMVGSICANVDGRQ